MQRGYTKLFNTIVTSTIWQEDDKTRIVWITMLAIADQYGIVSAAVPGLASVANVGVDAARVAVKNLLSPDPDSRTKDFDGRRIEEVDGGWKILNYEKYRRMLNEEERKEYQAKWVREKRRQKSTTIDPLSTVSTQAEAQAESREQKHVPKHLSDVLEYAHEIGLSDKEAEKFFDHFTSNGWKVGGRAPMKDWRASLRNWSRNPSYGAANQMSPQHRQNRINHLNEKKQKTNRMIKDPKNPPSWAVEELAKIDKELQTL